LPGNDEAELHTGPARQDHVLPGHESCPVAGRAPYVLAREVWWLSQMARPGADNPRPRGYLKNSKARQWRALFGFLSPARGASIAAHEKTLSSHRCYRSSDVAPAGLLCPARREESRVSAGAGCRTERPLRGVLRGRAQGAS